MKKNSKVFSKENPIVKNTSLPLTEFDAILNSIPDVIIRFDLNGKVVWWNRNLEDVVLLSNTELLSSYLSDLFKSCDGIELASLINDTLNNNNAEIDALLSTANGDKRYHLKSSLINEASEQEILIVGRDIDERSQMSDALQQSQAQLQKLIDGLPFSIYLISIDGKYLLANKNYCKFVGLNQEEIIGHTNKDIFNQDMIECCEHDNNKVIKEQKFVHYETTVDTNKNKTNFSVDKFPMCNDDGAVYAICVVVEDVTSQYQLQKQLQQTQKMEAIGQLTGGIAHDFNNVLASIMGYTSLTKRRAIEFKDEKIESYLNQITRSGERARDLVQQLLAFSRGDVGGLQIMQPEPLAKEAIKMLTSLIPSSINLNLKIRSNNVKHYIEVDPVQFHQSVMNLVINAKDAITDGSGSIDVSLKYLPNVNNICNSCHLSFSGNYILLSVSDNGQGISKKIIERIFDPFFTTKDVGKGSGMGLSMLHGIVHGSGGHIVIKSNTSKAKSGTTIEVYFPEVKPKNINEQQGFYSVEKVKNINIGKNILVIDDEVMITHYLSELLEDEGYNVVTYNDSLQALDYVINQKHNIDIIITDQTMPGLTGIELAKNIMNSRIDIPVILCTGYSDFSVDILNTDAGVDVFMNKPFDTELLLQHLTQLINLYDKPNI